MTIWMPVGPEANELLSRSPLALLIACRWTGGSR